MTATEHRPGATTRARRVSTLEDLVQAGDYSGPHPLIDAANRLASRVCFLLPVHTGRDKFDHTKDGNGLHCITSPPWTFRECPDGSLEIRASIGCGPPNYYWHGYLDEGNVWRQV